MIEVIERVRAAIKAQSQKPDWPYGLQYAITSDQSESIWDDLNAVANNAWQAMVGVFLVLFLVLSWREALIAGLAIPVTFMLALAVVWGLGNTLNQVVVVGLVLSLGLLVDVFILMMEGMHDGIFTKRRSFNEAALGTVKTYAAPAFAGQMTTILAMLPLMVIGGLAGKFISIIPETAVTTLIVSYIIALFVTVPLSRFLLAQLAGGKASPTMMDRVTHTLSERLRTFALRYSVRNRAVAGGWVLAAFAVLALSIVAGSSLTSEMFPKDDGRNLGITIELPPDAPLHEAQVCANDVGEALRKKAFLQSVTKFAGAKSPMAMPSVAEALTPSRDSYLVGFSAYFTPSGDRPRYAYTYVDELREELTPLLKSCPGGVLRFTPQTGGTSSEDPLQIVVEGDDIAALRAIAAELTDKLGSLDGVVEPRDTMGASRTDVKSVPRREVLDFHGLSLSDVAYQIRVAMTMTKLASSRWAVDRMTLASGLVLHGQVAAVSWVAPRAYRRPPHFRSSPKTAPACRCSRLSACSWARRHWSLAATAACAQSPSKRRQTAAPSARSWPSCNRGWMSAPPRGRKASNIG